MHLSERYTKSPWWESNPPHHVVDDLRYPKAEDTYPRPQGLLGTNISICVIYSKTAQKSYDRCTEGSNDVIREVILRLRVL